MKRRDVIKGGAIGAAAATALHVPRAPAQNMDRVEIAMVTTWPRDFPGLGTGAQRLAQRLSDMSDGRIQVEYFAAGERVKPFDSFDEVASGNAQAYHAADYYWKGKHPAGPTSHPYLSASPTPRSTPGSAGAVARSCGTSLPGTSISNA